MYNTHTISTLVSHLVPNDLSSTPSPESCETPPTSSSYFLSKNWCIITTLNPVPSVFCLQADMYVDAHRWLNLHFNPPITPQNDHLRQFNSGFTKRLSINQDLRTRKATYQFTGECLNLQVLGIDLLASGTERSNNLQTFLEGYFSVQKSRVDEIKFSLAGKQHSWKLKL